MFWNSVCLRQLSVVPHPGIMRHIVFAFYSNRLGCLGSIAVSVLGTILLVLLLRGCS